VNIVLKKPGSATFQSASSQPGGRRTLLTGGRARRSLFGAVGLVACCAPARRASRIDATEALRHD